MLSTYDISSSLAPPTKQLSPPILSSSSIFIYTTPFRQFLPKLKFSTLILRLLGRHDHKPRHKPATCFRSRTRMKIDEMDRQNQGRKLMKDD